MYCWCICYCYYSLKRVGDICKVVHSFKLPSVYTGHNVYIVYWESLTSEHCVSSAESAFPSLVDDIMEVSLSQVHH